MRPVLSRILLVCVLFLPLVVILSAPVERAEAQQQGKGFPVWITEYGTKYHYYGCRALWHSPRNYRVGLYYAWVHGYRPCKVCKTPIYK